MRRSEQPETFALDATHGRILQWLWHYPFQRLEDLVVALSPWNGRTSIYQHLKDLERARRVEVLTGQLGAGHALYHLSPLGLTWYLHTTGAARMNETALREVRAKERARLVQLLPRIPVFLTLQTAVNGLVLGAADALTQQGHRARLIQWNWQRDVTHAFTAQGHPMRWFADGVAAFCVQHVPPDGSPQEVWYRCFLLFMPLLHPRLMRARLDRLMRWREAKERWLVYSQMPSILILAQSERQVQWWNEAAARITHELEGMPPFGAITSLAACTDRAPWRTLSGTSLWQHPWKRLDNQGACHLRELFSPQDAAGFPELFPQDTRSMLVQEKERVEPGQMGRYQRKRPRPFALSASRGPRMGPEAWQRACLHTPPRTFELLVLLQAHPLLDRGNLGAHLHLGRSSLSHLLVPLIQAGLIAQYETPVGERFALSEDGLRLLAATSHCQVRHLTHRPGTTEGSCSRVETLVPRGLPGLLAQITHIAGVYGFFEELADLECLRWWETGTLCARFYQYQETWHGIRPDAVAQCQTSLHAQDRPWRFFLEWDRGTMHARDLRRKMGAYARYFAAQEWRREHQSPPALLCVVPDVAQEQALTRIALVSLNDCPVRVMLYTTTRNLLMTPGLAGSIWRQVVPSARRAPEEAVLLRLFCARPGASGHADERMAGRSLPTATSSSDP